MIDAAALIGSHDVVMITLDTLRLDVARNALAAGQTPHLASLLPADGWEARHSPASFTYAAHHAFFAGFLPTPTSPGPHPRLFAARFIGAESVDARTAQLDAPDIVNGLRQHGYQTICIGGTGFFNLATPLGRVLPDLFCEAHWSPDMGVTAIDSPQAQVALAVERLAALPADKRAFLFINIAAMHQPNCHYIEGQTQDNATSQQAALAHVDRALPPLLEALQARGPSLLLLFADHGTAYGEDGHTGHRIGHPVVWTVPYAQTILPAHPPALKGQPDDPL